MSKSLFDDLISVDEPVKVLEDTVDETPVDTIPDTDPTPPSEEEEEVEVDERVNVLYDILVDTGTIDKVEGFVPTVESFEELVEQLPEHFFMKAVSALPEHVQALVEYGFNNPEATVDDLAGFFNAYIEPTSIEEPVTDDDAYAYLKPILMENKLFASEAKVTKYLDELLDEGLLLDKAKELYAEQEQLRQQEMQEQLEQVRLAKEQAKEQQVAYYSELYDTVQSLEWEDQRKNSVLNNLRPEEVQRKNALIMQSPKAVVQLADIYTYFDESKGEFDFSEFGIRKLSKKLEGQKEKIQNDRVSSHLSKLKPGQQGSSESFWSSFKPVN